MTTFKHHFEPNPFRLTFHNFANCINKLMCFKLDACIDDEEMNQYYTDYKTDIYPSGESIEEWAEEFFKDRNFKEHDYMLISKTFKDGVS